MGLVTLYDLQCNCGHTGRMRRTIDYTPAVPDHREYFKLFDLQRAGVTPPANADDDVILEMIKPKCPRCGTILTTENLILSKP